MALKGTTKIELFDAVTGEKTDEVKSDNLVTNAVRNILNPSMLSFVNSNTSNLGSWLANISPISKTLFGGIMLFSDPIREDVDHIIPDLSLVSGMVGCGGQGASLPGNTYRGTYNGTESVELPDGFTHVWDFSSEQANGVISGVSLTSSWGGEAGWKATEPDLMKTFIPLCTSNSINDLVLNANDSTRGIRKGLDLGIGTAYFTGYTKGSATFFSGDKSILVCYDNDNVTKIKAVVSPLLEPKGLNSYLRSNDYSLTTNKENKEFFFEIPSYMKVLTTISGKDRVIYVGYSYSNPNTSIRMLEIKYDGTDCVFSDTTLVVPNFRVYFDQYGSYDDSFVAITDEFIYCSKYDVLDKLYKISRADPTIITEINRPNVGALSYTSIIFELGTVWLYHWSGTLIYYLNSDEQTWGALTPCRESGSNIRFPVLSDFPERRPWFGMRRLNYIDTYYLALLSPYLATINNLDEPVTKTPSKTMKITYTIQNT